MAHDEERRKGRRGAGPDTGAVGPADDDPAAGINARDFARAGGDARASDLGSLTREEDEGRSA